MNDIEVRGISKAFGTATALKNISFEVARGERFGLIGPDGAGKTTLFQILTTLLIPDAGNASVLSMDTVKDYRTVRKHIGYMPGRFSLYQDLTVEENLHFFATIFGTSVRSNYHLIEDIYVQLEPFRKRRAGRLSGGMKQKLALSCALIHEPDILFLDEPTTGVDAVSRAEFWEMLARLKAKNITIVVSTPYMDEASKCERIALIQEGRLLKIDTPENIIKGHKKPLYKVRAGNFYKLLNDLKGSKVAESVEPFGEYLHLTPCEGISKKEIEEILAGHNHDNFELVLSDPTIEDVFLDLM